MALLDKVVGDLLDSLLDRQLGRLDVQLRLERRLVRSRNTGELLDLTGTGLLVKALGITLLGNLNRDVNKDLDKRKLGLLVDLASKVAVGTVWRDERGDGNGCRISKELGNLANTTNVLVTVLLRESQVLVEAETNVVTVETVRGNLVVKQVLFEGSSNGARVRTLV